MKIWIAPYEHGFLIKLQSKQFRAGYADCRPWPVFKDASVEIHQKMLKERRLNSLLKRSIFFAHIDGVAREEQRSLWNSDLRLRSHLTLTHLQSMPSDDFLLEARSKGYRTLKLKVGRTLQTEVPICLQLGEKNWFRFRLDFNGVDADPFLQKMSGLFLSQVEFIEDPGAYDSKKWLMLTKKYGTPVALDQAEGAPVQTGLQFIKIVKPARENYLGRKQDVITNSLDHPVGQAFAALQAQESVRRLGRQSRDYGLQSAHLFSKSDYFEEMSTDTCYFQPIPGTGIGFDDLLEREAWKAL